MERNVMGELNVYRGSGAKPNFSEIARRHGMDRHTVAKYWREGESAADGRSARGSAFDPLEEVIRSKAQLPGMTKMAVYAFLREGRGEGLPGYGAFTAWCRARDVPFGGAGGREPHPRFETPPGRQLQFDWKEGMRLVDSEGEVFEFSVFTATLGYSRKHRFIPVRSRTLDDLLSCLLATFTRLGGVPEECITDNMSCLVTVSGRRRTRQERAWRFAREAGFELRLCAPRSPQTKGKDESANRFLNRLLAYGGEFTGWSGLAEAVARVEAQANSEPNRTTGLPPDALFMREKESLRPIGNLRLLESMVGDVSVQTVPSTMLVRAAGREWSVPRRCIGRRVSVVAMPGGQVVVRMAGEEVAVHDAASGPSRPINVCVKLGLSIEAAVLFARGKEKFQVWQRRASSSLWLCLLAPSSHRRGLHPLRRPLEHDQVAIVDDSVDHGSRHLVVGQDPSPPAELKIRGHDKASPLVALVHHLVQELGAILVYGKVPKLVQYHQIGPLDLFEHLLQGSLGFGLGHPHDEVGDRREHHRHPHGAGCGSARYGHVGLAVPHAAVQNEVLLVCNEPAALDAPASDLLRHLYPRPVVPFEGLGDRELGPFQQPPPPALLSPGELLLEHACQEPELCGRRLRRVLLRSVVG